MMNNELVCPKCTQLDMVQKVSSVFDGGTSYGSFTGTSIGAGINISSRSPVIVSGTQNLQGKSSTAISIRLSPPSKPTPPDRSIYLIFGVILIAISFPIALCGITLLFSKIASWQNTFLFSIILNIAIFIVSLLSLGTGIGIIITCLRLEKISKLEYIEAITTWEKAIIKWNKLYYCARDDGVFIPGETILVPTNRMLDFLYQ
jgi:hypothetical protein